MLQGIAVGMANHFGGRGVAGEVPFARWIAPFALRIPMPGLHEEFGVLPVADGAPASGKDLLDLVGPEEYIGGVAGDAIDGGAKGVRWGEGIDDVVGSGIDADGLRGSEVRKE